MPDTVLPQRSSETEPVEHPVERDKDVRLRRFPHPYRAMVAICSDIDHCRIGAFRETHRFLNTHENTAMGPGLGLDVADSFWMYKPRFDGDPQRDNLAYFADLSGSARSPFADEIVRYIAAGWIDTMHSYGNFSRAGAMPVQFTRQHALQALEVLERNRIKVRVWVNHGDRNNRQNVGAADYMHGDRPESPAYHLDLTRDYGIEYFWIGGDASPGAAVQDALVLNDGSCVFAFRRFQIRRNFPPAAAIGPAYDLRHGRDREGAAFLQVWRPQGLACQLSADVLEGLVERQAMCILGQHLGSLYPLTIFDREMVEALRRLRRFQDRRAILVARTARALHYARVRDHLRFSTRVTGEHQVIDITAVVDPVRGCWVPQIEDLRGITFDTDARLHTVVRLAGNPIAADELAQTLFDGRCFIGIRWFPPETSDHAAEFTREQTSYVIWSDAARTKAGLAGTHILDWLRDEARPSPGRIPEQIEGAKYHAAVDYAIGRYEVGLAHYAAFFEKIGFSEMRLGLDAGSEAGHLCLAFLAHGNRAVGVDPRPEFVALARRIAQHADRDKQLQFHLGDADGLDYPQPYFDCAWSHSRLMYGTDAGVAIERISRALRMNASFYCAYHGVGNRLRILHDQLRAGPSARIEIQFEAILAALLNRSGISHTPNSRVRALELSDLLRLCRTFGLVYVGQPNVHDGLQAYRGVPAAFDFVVRKRKPHDAVRSALLDRKPAEANWFEDLEVLTRAGCASLVCEVLETTDPGHADPDLFDLYARAMIRAGRAHGEARQLFEEAAAAHRLPPLTVGLYWHDQRSPDKALSAYEEVPDRHAEKAFLRGCCLLQKQDWAGAAQTFSSAIEKGAGELREFVGLAAALYRAGDCARAERAIGRFFELDKIGETAAAG